MWRDEAVTYDMTHRELGALWQTLGTNDAVHGLYYLTMKAVFALCSAPAVSPALGDADPLLVLRLPSVLSMAAAAAGVALLGRRLAGARAGLLAGVVFALLPPVQRFAQEGRSYAMVCALVVWATYALARAAGAGRRGPWTVYAALMLTACLLHEFALLALPAHGLTLRRAARRPWILAAAAVAAGTAPLAVVSQRQSAQVSWLEGSSLTTGSAGLIALGIGCAAFLARVRERRQHSGHGAGAGELALPVGLLVLPTLVLLLVSLVEPLYVDRYVLYSQAGLALLVGAALDRAARGTRPRAVAVAVTGAAVVLTLLPFSVQLRTPQSRIDDTTAVARAVREAGAPGDGLLYTPLRRRVWTLPYAGAAAGLSDLALARDPASSHTLYGTEVSAGVLRARMLRRDRIVVAGDPAAPATGSADASGLEAVKRDTLDAHFEACRSWHPRGARVTLYARPGQC
ncbi:hypothetical protein STRAU_7234 [Streptomyces aurantiacus JA 4570]|uniref:Glycosyltransferase RgtA/B/C/D-like domain-containing protein n=1 Tax=Streptomyces aurantiacus JA 4570 TaxID=1286094 RepID=S3Z7M7_9ACTN|nr:hypothetical protein STRAU_7234 [Streptomyces aurantiacus JA 4570]